MLPNVSIEPARLAPAPDALLSSPPAPGDPDAGRLATARLAKASVAAKASPLTAPRALVSDVVSDVVADAVAGGITSAAKSVSSAVTAAIRARSKASAVKTTTTPKTASKTTAKTTAKTTTSKTTTASKSTSKTTTSKTAAVPSSRAFLNDPRLSLEDKLMLLLAQLSDQYEKEMQQHMDRLAGGAGAPSSGGTTKKSGGVLGGLFDAVGSVVNAVPGLGALAGALASKPAQELLAKIGGPVLGAAASALGMPALAPALVKLGPGIASALGSVAKQVASSASGGGTAGAALSEGDKQLELMQLQRLQEKQREMFSTVSNVFRAMHETRSGIIGNIR